MNDNKEVKVITDTINNINTTLLIVFIVLKLTHNINWSWWLVLSPFWIPLAMTFIAVFIVGIVMLFDEKRR